MLKVTVDTKIPETRIIKCFEESGRSHHSPRAETLGILINYCEENNISYQLTAYPGKGYGLEKIKEGKVIKTSEGMEAVKNV